MKRTRLNFGGRLCPYLFLCVMLIAGSVSAQSTLTPHTPVEGSIPAEGATEIWRFNGVAGEVISLEVKSSGDGLDPLLTLTNSSGTLISMNDDIAYPGTPDALIQAVTLPRTDTYNVTVAGYKATTGGYTLTLTPGYPDILLNETFDDTGSTWATEQTDLNLDNAVGLLALSLSGGARSAHAERTSGEFFDDFYAEVVIASAEGRNGWIGGLTLRQDGDRFYALMLNDDRQWRFTLNTPNGVTVLRDWTNHPAIAIGLDSFTLSVLANGSTFDVFFNSSFIGQAVDPQATLAGGSIGLYAETFSLPDSSTLISFDTLLVTVPRRTGEEELIPDQLVNGGQALTIQELERRRLIPTGGQAALTVPESFGQRLNPGVNRLILGRGTTFGDLVISTELTWQTTGPGVVGCGLVFGSVSDTTYNLAYLDQTGGYGLSARVGDTFSPGIFGVNPDWTEGSQRLIVVRRGDTVHYYINQRHVGTLSLPAATGEIGVAVVNYETIDTTCRFNDTWVWRLPG